MGVILVLHNKKNFINSSGLFIVCLSSVAEQYCEWACGLVRYSAALARRRPRVQIPAGPFECAAPNYVWGEELSNNSNELL